MADLINGTVVVRDKIPVLRAELAELAQAVGDHIGSVGEDAHVIGDATQPGFMSTELYDFLLGFQQKIDDLQREIELSDLPDGSILYWVGADDTIPEGFKLCNGANGTPDNRDKFILGAASDSDLRKTGGKTSINLSSLPVPRHTHYFNNYCQCEVYSELQYNVKYSTGCSIKNTGGGWRGSNSESDGYSYPLYYRDTTNSTGTSTSSSSNTVNLEPSYYTLKTMIKTAAEVQYAADAVGTLHITFGDTIPDGCLELNGQQVDYTVYSALKSYAESAGLVVTSTDYTSLLNEYGSCPFFVVDESSSLMTLPNLKTVISGSALYGTKYHAGTTVGDHFHGLGKMRNNNGYWGRYSYSGTSYPSGTAAWSWNGSGGLSGGSSSMETTGDIIFTHQISVGASGNGEVCSNTGVTFSIRAYHPNASVQTLSDDELATAAMTADAAVASLEEDMTVIADYGSIIDKAGWLKENDGLVETWGDIEAGDNQTLTISYPLSFESGVAYIDVHNTNAESSEASVVSFDTTSMIINLGSTFSPADKIEYRVLGY